MVRKIFMLKDRYIFCYKNVRMRTTKNLCMRKFRNLNFRNRHVPKHWHTNFHEIPRDSWIFSLYVVKFHHLSATCRLMIVMNFAQIVIFYLHKILKPKILYSKLIGTNLIILKRGCPYVCLSVTLFPVPRDNSPQEIAIALKFYR